MYRVIVVREKRDINRERNGQAVRRFCNKIRDIIQDALVIEKPNEVVIIAANQHVDHMKPPRWLNALGNESFEDDSPIVIGIGPASNNAADIHWSYNLAKNTIIVGLAVKKSGVLYYMEYLPDLVLLGSAGTHEQEFLVSQVIEPIKEHDSNTLLLKTIDASIFADDLEAAASVLSVHINTVRYRLNRIHDITGFDFFTAKGRYVITTAYLMSCYKKYEL
jgi:purine catabolism regulator